MTTGGRGNRGIRWGLKVVQNPAGAELARDKAGRDSLQIGGVIIASKPGSHRVSVGCIIWRGGLLGPLYSNFYAQVAGQNNQME